MNRQEAARLVAVMMAACPAQSGRIDNGRAQAMVDSFASLLDDVTYEQANAAARVLLQTRSWLPSVAEIRATVLEIEHGGVQPGGEQWGVVLECIHRYGAYRVPGADFTFRDPVTARCVKALGWQELCLSENQVADRAKFVDLYDRLAAQVRREQTSPLLGAAKQARELRGGDVSPVVRQLAGKLGAKS